jgi:hypothetical protein
MVGKDNAVRRGRRRGKGEGIMAKKKTATATKIVKIPQPVVVRGPTALATRPKGGRLAAAAGMAQRGLKKAALVAKEEKHTMYAVAAAGLAGWLSRDGTLQRLPHVTTLGVEGTYGLVALFAGRQMNSAALRHIATGLLSVAVHEFAKSTTMFAGGGAAPGGGGRVP